MKDEKSEEERWEFASAEWCQFAGELGVRLIEAAKLDLSRYEWGFSEIYTHTPPRLMAGREEASYHFMITGGRVSGGAGVPEACLALKGFHVKVPWGAIAHASSYLYDQAGQRARGADERELWREISEAIGEPTGKAAAPDKVAQSGDGKPRCPVCGSPDHERAACPVWPPGIGEALSVGASEGGGLHNLTAKRLKHSPELIDLPKTEWGVPILAKMTADQKARFLKLIGK